MAAIGQWDSSALGAAAEPAGADEDDSGLGGSGMAMSGKVPGGVSSLLPLTPENVGSVGAGGLLKSDNGDLVAESKFSEDGLVGAAEFSAEISGLLLEAEEPLPDELSPFSGEDEQPAITVSTPASNQAKHRNNREESQDIPVSLKWQ